MKSARVRTEEIETATLAPNATKAAQSKGRERPEEPHPLRTDFQRDRDRILHAKAFRRLAHKTQVFLAPEGDHYRVRLTHTLEVAQVARTIARALRLNEDLTEAICLGHDLGHTPFGHLGEEVLSEFLGRPFKHNVQSLRVVDVLEGEHSLNLTWEVRDGILNHTWSMPEPSTLEAQVARFADRIAYVNHDIDDAMRAGVLADEDLPTSTVRVLGKTSSARVDSMVSSVAEFSSSARVAMAPQILETMNETRRFLFERVYVRPEVKPEHDRARALLQAICRHYRSRPAEVPISGRPEDDETRMVDYVAGMTDRFARREYERITGGASG